MKKAAYYPFVGTAIIVQTVNDSPNLFGGDAQTIGAYPESSGKIPILRRRKFCL